VRVARQFLRAQALAAPLAMHAARIEPVRLREIPARALATQALERAAEMLACPTVGSSSRMAASPDPTLLAEGRTRPAARVTPAQRLGTPVPPSAAGVAAAAAAAFADQAAALMVASPGLTSASPPGPMAAASPGLTSASPPGPMAAASPGPMAASPCLTSVDFQAWAGTSRSIEG
jgi:hypothetical protein